jgi:serine/threonine protein kinase
VAGYPIPSSSPSYSRFGDYILLDRINVGGMAEVYRGKKIGVEGFAKMVALKRILPNIAEDEEFIEMFVDEAKLASQMHHANVVQIHDLGKTEGSYFIAMEYISGVDLRTVWDRARKRNRLLPIAMSCYLMQRVCEGLDYAHRKKDDYGHDFGLVHRDVSPQNVLVSFEGEVKVVDFGIAKAKNKVSKTQAGILKGKFGYMSPEQVRGVELDNRSDIFACGVLLWELLVGDRLFLGESDFSTLEKVRNVETVPPTQLNKNLSPQVERIVMKALSKSREDRYRWASEMAEDLQRYLFESNQPFQRADLQRYMKQHFEKEISEEFARLEKYRALNLADLPAAKSAAAPGGPGPANAMGAGLAAANVAGANGQVAHGATAVGNLVPNGGLAPRPFTLPTGGPGVPPGAPGVPPGARVGLGNMPATAQWGPGTAQATAPGMPPMHGRPGMPTMPGMPGMPGHPTGVMLPPGIGVPAKPRHGLPTWARVSFLGLGVIVLGLLAVLVAHQAGLFKPAPGSITIDVTPPDVTISINDEVVARKSPFTLDNLAPGTYVLAVQRADYKRLVRAVKVGEGEARMESVALEPVEGTASIFIRTTPKGIAVWLDGKDTGKVSPTTLTGLQGGTHDLVLMRDGDVVYRASVKLDNGGAEPIEVDISRLPPVLEVSSARTGARVTVNGRGVGQVPVRVETLAPGKVRVRVDAKDCKPYQADVELKQAVTAHVEAALECAGGAPSGDQAGQLNVTASAPADVFVDGARVGRTPAMGLRISGGKHAVKLVPLSGDKPPFEQEVMIEPGKLITLDHPF